MSVYYQALRARGAISGGPTRSPLIALSTAAGILSEDSSPVGKSRRRRAIAVLVGSCTIGRTPEEWAPRDFAHAIQIMGGQLDGISGMWFSHHPPAPAPPGTPGPPDANQALAQEQAARNFLNSTASPLPAECCACLNVYDIDPPPELAGNVAMASFKITVQAPASTVRSATDPRCWAKCNPEFFDATNMVTDCSGSGTLLSSASPSDCGTVQLNGPLLELMRIGGSMTCAGPGPDARFTNILNITAVPSTSDYQTNYNLCKSIDSKLPCQSSTPGGVDVDCGCAKTVSITPSETTLFGVKYLKFSDPSLGDLTIVGLKAMVDYILDRGVCCGGSSAPAESCQLCADPILDEDGEKLPCSGPAKSCP
jgi:hypothetical protein